jgi:hypothetical protein
MSKKLLSRCDKEGAEVLASAISQGFVVRLTKNGHYVVASSDGKKATVSGKCGEWRTLQNTKAALKRIGWVEE